MKKQHNKSYLGKTTVLAIAVLALSAIYVFEIAPPAAKNIAKATPKPTSEQPFKLNNKDVKTIDTTDADTPLNNATLNTKALSIDSLKKILFPEGDPAWAWAKVDIDRLQSEMPDNLYWELAAPTSDEWLIEHRQERKEFWADQYGQVLSNRASEKQIRAYYAHQHQVSTDYVIFATQLLNRHIKDLPERDVSFQKLARNLHLARLEELPKKLSNAIARREQQIARRAEWLADKEAFEEALRIEREDAERLLKQS